MKIWEKDIPLNKQVEQFTIGRDPEFDMDLAPFDALGSMAHATMLGEVGILTESEVKDLLTELKKILQDIEDQSFSIDPGMEDVHSQIEWQLTQKIGDAGKRLHTGRSRNDQVLVDLRMYFRASIKELMEDTSALFETLLQQSERFKDILIPGYTHLQAAMPSSFGLWFGAYAENLIDDIRQWNAVLEIINQNPLGSGAGYGSSVPLNRKRTTELLGFSDLDYNVVHAQMGRGRSEMFMSFAIASTANTLSKLAMDVCLFNSQNFGFLKLPDAFTTGSSIMPHKKNPDVFELIRAKSNLMSQLPGSILGMIGHLPSGYHRDFQLLKELIFPAIESLKDCIELTRLAITEVAVHEDIMKDPRYKLTFSVEVVNDMVSKGIPFRDAYQEIAKQIEAGTFEAPQELAHTHEGSIGNLCNDAIREKFQKVWRQIDFSFEEKLAKLQQ